MLRDPRLLQRMARVGRQALYGGDVATLHVLEGVQACIVGLAVDVDRAGSALADAAAELGARQLEVLSQHPKQRSVGQRSDSLTLAVDGQRRRDLLAHDAPPR